MPRKMINYDVLVSCPADVVAAGYLDSVKRSVDFFNSSLGILNNLHININYWQEDSFPQSGGKPQDLLNRQIVDESDAAIAIFYTRFGTPTDEFGSGTEEEIEQMISSGKQVFMYFVVQQIDPSKIDTTQLQKVRDFKTRYQQKGLYQSVTTTEELYSKLVTHLSKYFLDKIDGQSTEPNEGSDLIVVNRDETTEFVLSPLIKHPDNNKNSLVDSIVRINNNSVTITNDFTSSIVRQNNFMNSIASGYYKTEPKQFSQNVIDTVNAFAKSNGITLDADFFNLGNLKYTSGLPTMPVGRSTSLIGSDDEKKRYNSIIKLKDDIDEFNDAQQYFKQLNKLSSLDLALINCGTSYDEDIEITLKAPADTFVRANEIPVPGDAIITKFKNDRVIDAIFGLLETPSIDAYSYDRNSAPKLEASLPSFVQPSNAEIIKESREDYKSYLDDMLSYEYFSEDSFDILKINFEYLKQHTSMWFPSKLLLKQNPGEIKYTITAKHSSKVIKGTIDLKTLE